MATPLAYLLTWTTYGTWLHGDERGSADRHHSTFRTPYLSPDRGRISFERSELKHDPVTLSADARRTVEQAICAHIDHRRWKLHAINVRTNHVHVVVSCPGPPEPALREFKAWATRRLREQNLSRTDARVWTRHGSTRYLFDERSLTAAIRYVVEHQGPRTR